MIAHRVEWGTNEHAKLRRDSARRAGVRATVRRAGSCALAVCAAAYAVLVASAVPAVMAWITNSDQLTIPALVVDVVAQPANFFGWQVSRASYLFPDLVSYAAAYLLTGDALHAIVLAQIPVLLAWLYVVYRAAPGRAQGGHAGPLCWAIFAGLLVPLALTQLSGQAAAWITKYVFSFSNHFSCFVVSMVLLWWTLDELSTPSRARLVGIGVVAALMAASNRAIWLFYGLPAAIVVIAVLLRTPRRAAVPTMRVAVVVLAAMAAGYAIEGSFNRIAVMPYELTTSSIDERSRAFFATLSSYAAEQPAVAAGLLALIALYVAALVRLAAGFTAFRRGRLTAAEDKSWLFDLAVMLTAGANVLAAMMSWQNIGNARYLMLFFFAPPLLMARVWWRPWSVRALVAASVAAFALTAVAAVRNDGPRDIATYARAATAPIATCLRDLHVGRGLANYWTARRLAFLSADAIRVDQVSPGAGRKETLFFYWGNNAYAYLRGHPELDAYDYVIADDLDPSVLRAAFGSPDAVHDCAGHAIWTWHDPTRLFGGLFQGHLDPWQRLLARDWSATIPAAAFVGTTGSGEGLARVADQRDAAGLLLTGGRLTLRAGTYRVVLAYAAPGNAGTHVGTLSIAPGGGHAAAFVDLLATADARVALARTIVNVDEAEGVVEPQVQFTATGPLRVEHLSITRMPAEVAREIRLQAGDSHVHTLVGALRGGALVSTGKGGVLAYGPYLPLAAGRYRAFVHLVAGRAQPRAGKVDVVARAGRAVLAERAIESAADAAADTEVPLIVDFDVSAPVRDLELRVFVDEGASVELRGYEILPRAGDAVAASASHPAAKSAP